MEVTGTRVKETIKGSFSIILGKLKGSDLVRWQQNYNPYCEVKTRGGGFPGGAVVENLPADAGDTGSSPGLGRSHMPRSD